MKSLTRTHPGLPGSSLNEKENHLWASLRRDQSGSFWSFWNYYEQDLLRLCRSRLRSYSGDAEDVLSEAMLKAHIKIPRYIDQIRNPRSWLFTLTRNTCIDHLRKRKREAIYVGEPVLLDSYQSVPVMRDDLERRLLGSEMLKDIERAFDALPLTLRDTARYRFLKELEYEEIALKLRISPSCARKRIQKAREILCRALRSYRDNENGTLHATVA